MAEYAGCHLYNKDDDVLYSNQNFVTIHAAYKGKHTLYFKEPVSLYEVYEKQYYGHNVTSIELEYADGRYEDVFPQRGMLKKEMRSGLKMRGAFLFTIRLVKSGERG